MPYFMRKPYADTLVRPLDARPPGPPAEEAAEAAPSIMALARSVLAETGEAGAETVRLRAPVAPGGEGTARLRLSAEDGAGPVDLRLAPRMLRRDGSVIEASAVVLAPDAVRIAPGRPVEVTVRVRPPRDAAQGLYAGTIRAEGDERFDIPLEVEVREAGT